MTHSSATCCICFNMAFVSQSNSNNNLNPVGKQRNQRVLRHSCLLLKEKSSPLEEKLKPRCLHTCTWAVWQRAEGQLCIHARTLLPASIT